MNSIDRPSWFPKTVWNFLFTYKDEYKPPVINDDWKMTEKREVKKEIPYRNLPVNSEFQNYKSQPIRRPSRTKDYTRNQVVKSAPHPVRKTQEETHVDYSRNDSSNDFVTGMIIGSLINSQNDHREDSAPAFESGKGGDFGGGGASGSWDEPTNYESSSSSSDSSSSSSSD